MDVAINIFTLFCVGILSLVICVFAVRLLDRLLFPSMDFERQLGNGNVAVGIFLGALVLGISC